MKLVKSNSYDLYMFSVRSKYYEYKVGVKRKT
jgi:hypothetical protein